MRLAIGLAGAAIGNFIAPGIGGQIGFAVASYGAGVLLAEDTDASGPRIEDGSVTTSAYGQILPRVWGVFPVAGNIIDASPVREVATEDEQSAKGGPTHTTTTYTYFSDMDIAVHDGEIQAVLQIKANGRVIFDASPTAGVVKPDWLNYTLYPGTETQNPDPTMEATHGAGNVPAYRGTAHVVFEDFAHSEFGNSFAINFEFLIAVAATSGTTLQATQVMVTGEDSERQGGLIEPLTDLLIFPLSRSIGQTYAITAVNPLTRTVAWQTPAGSIEDFSNPTLKPKLTLTDVGYIATPGEIAVIAGEEGTPQYIWTIDAISGVVTDISPAKTSTKYMLDLVYDWYDVNPAAKPFYIINRGAFNGYDFYYGFDTETEVEPPTGWYFTSEIYSSGEGDILVFLADADVSATAWAISVLDSTLLQFTTPTAISSAALYAVRGDDSWWVLESNTPAIFKEFDDDGTLLNTVNFNTDYSISGTVILGGPGGVFYHAGNNTLMMQITTSVYELRLDDLTTAPVEYSGIASGTSLTLYHSVSGRVWYGPYNDEDAHSANLFAASGQVASLDDVVSDLSIENTELVAGDIDVTALSAIDVRGIGVSKATSRRAVISQLQMAYAFDYVPRSGDLTAILRGATASVTLTEDEIGAHIDGSSPPPAWTVTRRAGNELPDMVEITFVDPDHNYEASTQLARRQASTGGTTERVSLAIALSNDEGAQIADVFLHLLHIESEQYKATCMPSTIDDVQPGEVLSTTYDGVDYTYRAANASIIDGRMIDLVGLREVPSVFTNYAVGGDPRSTDGSVNILGATILWPLDIPLLRTIDNNPGVYTAGTSFTANWPGAEIQRSSDGLSYSYVETLTTQAVMGTAVDAPTTGRAGFWDTTTELTVRLIAGALSSTTRDAPSYAAWGSNGNFEIIAFVTASQNTDGSWAVTDLARGLRDTQAAVGNHAIGDQFVVLDETTLGRVVYGASSIDAVEILRGITLGRTAASAIDVRYTFTAEALECFAPTRLHGEIDGSSNWDLEWMRQDRLIGRAFWQVSNSESAETYLVEILDDADTVVRPVTVTGTNIYQYSHTHQIADFGAVRDELAWRVSQVSALAGNGHLATSNIGLTLDYPGAVLAESSLISYHRLDETSGTTADDAGSSSYDLTYAGGYTLDQFPLIKTGKCVDFDGSDAQVYGAISQSVLRSVKCIECVFEVDAFPGSNYALLVGHDAPSGYYWKRWLVVGSDDKVHFLGNVAASAFSVDVTGAALSTGTKYHVICNFSGITDVDIYINGALYATGTSGLSWAGTLDQLSIGKSTAFTTIATIDGRIDEVSQYDAELDATQRANHFARGGVA